MPHIQIKNVPPSVHEALRRSARERGQTLSEYLLAELREIAGLPTVDEWIARVRHERRASVPYSAAELVRAERDEHARS